MALLPPTGPLVQRPVASTTVPRVTTQPLPASAPAAPQTPVAQGPLVATPTFDAHLAGAYQTARAGLAANPENAAAKHEVEVALRRLLDSNPEFCALDAKLAPLTAAASALSELQRAVIDARVDFGRVENAQLDSDRAHGGGSTRSQRINAPMTDYNLSREQDIGAEDTAKVVALFAKAAALAEAAGLPRLNLPAELTKPGADSSDLEEGIRKLSYPLSQTLAEANAQAGHLTTQRKNQAFVIMQQAAR